MEKVKNIGLFFVILGVALTLIACSEAENPGTADPFDTRIIS